MLYSARERERERERITTVSTVMAPSNDSELGFTGHALIALVIGHPSMHYGGRRMGTSTCNFSNLNKDNGVNSFLGRLQKW